MTWLAYSTEPVSGWVSSKYAGLGVRAADINSTGTNGPALLYVLADLNLPAGADDEWAFSIVDYPAAGTLTADENGDFTFSGAPAGYYKIRISRTRNGIPFGDISHALIVGAVPGMTLSASGRLVFKAAIAQGDKLVGITSGRLRASAVPNKLTRLQTGRIREQ